MRARILRPEEWGRINSPELPALLSFVDPGNVAVVVVEDDAGEIVASCSALQTTHFEGLWIEPKHRGNAAVVRQMIRQLYAVPRSRGEKWAFATADVACEQMDSVCRRLGGHPMPVKFFVMPLGD